MYLISACLAGFKTRYNGRSADLPPEIEKKIKRLIMEGKALVICPELLAGLPIPRPPLEFLKGDGADILQRKAKVISQLEMDYSEVLLRGAEETLRIAKLYNISSAIFKDGSPSCGVTYVYKEGKKIKGVGVVTAVLKKAGIKVKTVDSL